MTETEALEHIETARRAITEGPDGPILDTMELRWTPLRRKWFEILNQLHQYCQNKHEGFIPLQGHPQMSYEGYILWVIIFEERRFGWIGDVAQALSDETMTATCEGNEPSGIRIKCRT